MTIFKNANMQRMYVFCRKLATEGGMGRHVVGSNAYHNGFDGHPARHVRNSLAYAAWAAGRDDRRARLKAAQKGDAVPPLTPGFAQWLHDEGLRDELVEN